jgi:hypothetical protein
LLNVPLDEVAALSDLTIWDLSGFTSTFATRNWKVDDSIRYGSAPDDSDVPYFLVNARTEEIAGAYSRGVGSLAVLLQTTDGVFCVAFSLDDGTEWSACVDKNEVRRWQIGDQIVVFEDEIGFSDALNLRTGRVVSVN